jgi:hypothetical protein
MDDIGKLSVEQIIDHLCERCDWLAIVAADDERNVIEIVHGADGLQILGGIQLLLRTHSEACQRAYSRAARRLLV